MSALLSKLVGDGAGVPPVILGLLKLAAAPPGVFEKGKRLALSRRLSRHWVRVCEAWRACLRAGVLDGPLPSMEAEGLFFEPETGLWRALPGVGHDYRLKVALALEAICAQKAGHRLESVVIGSFADLRGARKLNGLPPMSRLGESGMRIESGLVGGWFVASWLVHSRRLFFLFEHDEHGKLRWENVYLTKAAALAVLNGGGE